MSTGERGSFLPLFWFWRVLRPQFKWRCYGGSGARCQRASRRLVQSCVVAVDMFEKWTRGCHHGSATGILQSHPASKIRGPQQLEQGFRLAFLGGQRDVCHLTLRLPFRHSRFTYSTPHIEKSKESDMCPAARRLCGLNSRHSWQSFAFTDDHTLACSTI